MVLEDYNRERGEERRRERKSRSNLKSDKKTQGNGRRKISHHNTKLPRPRPPERREAAGSSWSLRGPVVGPHCLCCTVWQRLLQAVQERLCGLFIRTRAAERGGTSGRGPEKVGTGWH